MWRLYCKNLSEAVVIRSKVKSLVASLPPEIAMSPITYIDFASPHQFRDYFAEPFRIKRISFSHEQEVRLITQDMPITNSVDGRKRFDMSSPNDRLGKSIQLAHFEDLIEEIRLSPFAAPWLHRTLSDLLQKLGVTIPINKSEIEIYPFAAH